MILGLVVLMFVAGISVVGISHQTAWHNTSPEPFSGGGLKAAARSQQANNLKMMALAMHDYSEDHGTLPSAAIWSKDGRPLLSWRVLILPYIEHQNLYKEFHLDEPWDSPHNLRLLPRMPRVYVSPLRNDKPDHTANQVLVGKGAAFEGKQGLRLRDDFPDGTSKTILIIEAAEAVPWTKPEDLSFDPSGPLPPLGTPPRSHFLAAMADGSVHLINRIVSDQTLRAAITRNGGEWLDPEW
jgi:hypothetical protein